MKAKILCAVCTAVIFNMHCLASNTTISGTIKNNNINEVRIGLYTNPIEIIPVNYTCKVKNEAFNISFDLAKPAYGFIDLENVIYNIFVIPGKKIVIMVNHDLVTFKGQLANENSFLTKLKGDKQWNYTDYNTSLGPDSVYTLMKLKQARYLRLLYQSNKQHLLAADFIRFFKAEDACRFNKFLINFPTDYSRVNHLLVNDKVFHKNYNHAIKYYCNDSYINCPSYLTNIQRRINGIELVYLKRLKKLEFYEARNIILTDSLTGKTRDYAIANQIYLEFVFDNKQDTAFITKFIKNATDPTAIASVNQTVNNYKFNNSFKNKSLTLTLKNTVLVDTGGTEIKLGDLLALHQGKVLYVDIWQYFCPPCRAEVPFAKELRATYQNSTVDFINIVTDTGKDLKPWSQYFEVAGTKTNHYRFKNGFNAELLKWLNIKGTPQYLIINKESQLAEWDAPRPSEGEKLKSILDKLIK